jgi:hypothetical protein
MAETPRFAHLVALTFLGSGFLTIVCASTAIVAVLTRKYRFARFAGIAAVVIVAGYGILWLGVAAASHNKTLQAGGWKYFCEADCHIAYQVESTQFASTIGPEAKPATARGQFVIVRLKTWFDERTISPTRGNSPLTPDPRTVQLVDDAGYRYLPLERMAAKLGGVSTPMNDPLRPGESYETNLIFDIPPGAKNPRLLISDEDPMSRLLIDHENSPLHGKIYLTLQNAPAGAVGAKP